MQELHLLVHLIDLLNSLLRCNGFAGIQKAVVGQTSSKSPNSDHVLFFFFGASLALGSALELILHPATELVFSACPIKSTSHHMSQSD